MPTPSHAEVWVQLMPTADGGRSSAVLLAGYRPHLRVAGGDYLGVEFVDGPPRPLHPGEGCTAKVRFLYQPSVSYQALAMGAEFEVLEGSRIVGSGHVSGIQLEGQSP